jgi:hypothetical protein
MRKLLVFGFFFLGLTTLSFAGQRGAMAPAAPAPAMRAMPSAVHAMPAAPVARGHALPARAPVQARPGTRTVTSGMKPVVSHGSAWHPMNPQHPLNPQPPLNPFFPPGFIPGNAFTGQACFIGDCNPVPGLGFDYTHFFAVHPNWGLNHPVSGVVLPFFGGGGFYMPVPYYTESTPQEGEQQAASNEQQQPSPQSYQQESAAPSYSRQNSYTYTPAEPVAEFVFVKRDGTTFNAVAYTLLKGKLQYVTKEGLRRTVPIDSLDLEATQKSNEDRGTTIDFSGLPHSA